MNKEAWQVLVKGMARSVREHVARSLTANLLPVEARLLKLEAAVKTLEEKLAEHE